MSERRPPPDPQYDYDDEPGPRPFWRRRPVIVVASLAAFVVVFLVLTQTPSRKIVTNPTDAAIGATIAYQPPPPEPAPKPPPVRVIPPEPPPPPPELGKKTKVTDRPAMLSYAVPNHPTPKAPEEPKDPEKTGLKFSSTTLPGMKASPSIDSTYMLMPGLLFCELDVEINSSLPGPLLCHLPGPVYSTKGVLLMEAETQVIGKYESLTQNGVNRLMAVSSYAHTPNDIWVPLTNQPLAEALGTTGLTGSIDHRYIERFGGAVLLDLAQNALQIAQAEVSKGGNTYVNLNSTNGLASEILRSTIDLPPLFSKHQGQLIAIWLTEPIDFSESYKLRASH